MLPLSDVFPPWIQELKLITFSSGRKITFASNSIIPKRFESIFFDKKYPKTKSIIYFAYFRTETRKNYLFKKVEVMSNFIDSKTIVWRNIYCRIPRNKLRKTLLFGNYFWKAFYYASLLRLIFLKKTDEWDSNLRPLDWNKNIKEFYLFNNWI